MSQWDGRSVTAADSKSGVGQLQRPPQILLSFLMLTRSAKALHAIGVCTRKELLARFDVTSLSEFKKPLGTRQQKVGKRAERILLFADAMETKQEKVLAVPQFPKLRTT